MADPIRPELDYAAFGNAALAHIESHEGTDAGRLKDAIRAYLYSVANVREDMYPSWHEVRTYLQENRRV
ncbi:hypothetical protein [Nocardia sp. NPDC059239]|uniref:hypothetical protein n=1 Tax=unclassified Nocardia TaxID=2637762 RepID=UPI00368F7531